MNRYPLLVAFILSVSLYSFAAGPSKPEWTRTATFRALSASAQTRLLSAYEKQVEQVADMFRARAPAPLSVEKDQTIVGTARCVIDEVMAESMRQASAAKASPETDYERYLMRCAERQGEKLKAAESRAAPKMNVVDYLLDYRQNLGRTVAVKGSLAQRGDLTLLYPPGRPDAFVLVDTDALSRDERKRILLTCPAGCEIQIYGEVKDIAGQKGLSAIRLY